MAGTDKTLSDTGNSAAGAAQAVSGAGNSVAGAGSAVGGAGNSVAGAAQVVSGAGSSLAGTPPARNGVSFSALEAMFRTAIEQPEIVALSIGTRPDCLDNRMIQLLAELNRIKPVWVELGLQTIHDKTAVRINRGYPLEVFLDTWERLKAAGLAGIVHLIFGLPGETEEDMLESAAFLGKLQPAPDGVKFANLQILRGTKTADEFAEHPEDFQCFNMEDYACFLERAVSLLAPQTVVHRLTGDGPKALLIEPKWSADKKRVLNCLKAHGLL
ncbi:MAG: radical SAM protein [Treponemataceae bacterium]|nr:radical SAM protein [Treponemataceae bacterium]